MNAMKLSLLKNFMILDLKVSMELSAEHAKVLIMPQDEEEIMPIGQTDISVNTDYIFYDLYAICIALAPAQIIITISDLIKNELFTLELIKSNF